jgi:hypothetical protein
VSDNDQPQPQQEREIREGAWQAIQQGAQAFGEIGVGAGGLAAAVKVLGEKVGGGSSGGSPPAPTNESTSPPSGSAGQE